MPNEKEISKLESDELDKVAGGRSIGKKYYLFDGRGGIAQYQNYPFEILDENGDVLHRCNSESTARKMFAKVYEGEPLEEISWYRVKNLRAYHRYREQFGFYR